MELSWINRLNVNAHYCMVCFDDNPRLFMTVCGMTVCDTCRLVMLPCPMQDKQCALKKDGIVQTRCDFTKSWVVYNSCAKLYEITDEISKKLNALLLQDSFDNLTNTTIELLVDTCRHLVPNDNPLLECIRSHKFTCHQYKELLWLARHILPPAGVELGISASEILANFHRDNRDKFIKCTRLGPEKPPGWFFVFPRAWDSTPMPHYVANIKRTEMSKQLQTFWQLHGGAPGPGRNIIGPRSSDNVKIPHPRSAQHRSHMKENERMRSASFFQQKGKAHPRITRKGQAWVFNHAKREFWKHCKSIAKCREGKKTAKAAAMQQTIIWNTAVSKVYDSSSDDSDDDLDDTTCFSRP